MRALSWVGIIGALPFLACQTPAILRTARTLPKGAVDISASVNITNLSTDELVVDGEIVRAHYDFTYPNFVPELLLNYGVSDDFEIGGKVSLGSGSLEANVKYRFVHAADGALHVAAAPSAAYRTLGLVSGPVFTLPLLLTYDVSEGVSLSGGPLISYAAYDVPDSLETDDADIGGDTLYAGGAVGVELRLGRRFHIMPSVELQRSVSRSGEIDDLPDIDLLFLSVTAGFASGGGD
jgi:hypothetical protein